MSEQPNTPPPPPNTTPPPASPPATPPENKPPVTVHTGPDISEHIKNLSTLIAGLPETIGNSVKEVLTPAAPQPAPAHTPAPPGEGAPVTPSATKTPAEPVKAKRSVSDWWFGVKK